MKYEITEFDNSKHRDQVISLWKEVFGYEAAHNAPDLVIDKKINFGDGLFFVAGDGRDVIGTVMAGYDGHRGWIYSIAVSPAHQNKGLGSALLSHAEKMLLKKGCMKINLQIMEGNESVEKFYLSNGYQTEKRISMGKRLPQNIKTTEPKV
ncbi:MAG: GNAT family acetyltransferase [Desulfobacter sp.]|nr:MAG: GNAT family acetyltransferase [Desulfobacter sp.]